jgi:hypothetical protein
MRRLIGVVLVVASCGGSQAIASAPATGSGSIPSAGVTPAVTQATAQATASTGPSAVATATPQPTFTPQPTREATPRPTAAPQATSDVHKGDIYLRLYRADGYVQGQVILEVTNTGGTWADISSYDSSYTIYAENGDITEASSFTSAAPHLIGPGETSYLFTDVFDEAALADYDHAEGDGYYDDARELQIVLTVTDTKVRDQDFGGVEVVGKVNNPGSQRVDSCELGAIFLNAKGEPMGVAWTYVDNIEPGGSRSFQATADAPRNTDGIAETKWYCQE